MRHAQYLLCIAHHPIPKTQEDSLPRHLIIQYISPPPAYTQSPTLPSTASPYRPTYHPHPTRPPFVSRPPSQHSPRVTTSPPPPDHLSASVPQGPKPFRCHGSAPPSCQISSREISTRTAGCRAGRLCPRTSRGWRSRLYASRRLLCRRDGGCLSSFVVGEGDPVFLLPGLDSVVEMGQ